MSSFFDKFTIDDLLDEMEAVYLNDKRPWIIGYSSGKDSSCVLHLTFKMLKRLLEKIKDIKQFMSFLQIH